MKMTKQLIPILFLLAAMIGPALSIRSILKKATLAAKLPAWSSSFQEHILTESSKVNCKDTGICRTWNEIRDVATCKSSKVAKLIPGKSIYYVMTAYKTTAQGEWAKFIYGVVEDNNAKPGELKEGVFFIRVCVPVDASSNAWLDDRCPLDDCGDISLLGKDCIKSIDEKNLRQLHLVN